MGKHQTLKDFIERARIAHGDKYDYSLVEFNSVIDKVTIICPEHGKFEQVAREHYRGKQCRQCSYKYRKKRVHTGPHTSLKEFVQKSIAVHGTKYDYSLVKYKGVNFEVSIVCPEHGIFKQIAYTHLRGSGCPKCGFKYRKKRENSFTKQDFIDKSIAIHGNTYDYSLVKYVRSNDRVTIICPDHGEFEQIAGSHLSGSGCNLCGIDKALKIRGDNIEKSGNNFGALCPGLLKEWDYEKNKISPFRVGKGSKQKAWWLCSRGHQSYQACIGDRTSKGVSCPICGGNSSKLELLVYSYLKVFFKKISWREKIDGYEADFFLEKEKVAIEVDGYPWHDSDEKYKVDLQKKLIFENAGIQLLRIRDERNREISGEVNTYSSRSVRSQKLAIKKTIGKIIGVDEVELNKKQESEREKYFYELIVIYPDPPFEESLLGKVSGVEEVWSKSNILHPMQVWSGSPEKFQIICVDCSTEFVRSAGQLSLTHSFRCSACASRKVGADRRIAEAKKRTPLSRSGRDDLLKEWSPDNDLSPDEVSKGSSYVAKWICSKNSNHIFSQAVGSRTGGDQIGCPYCSNTKISNETSLATLYPDLLKEWDYKKNKISPDSIFPGSSKQVFWKCYECGHSWKAIVYNRTGKKSGCPKCRDRNRKGSKLLSEQDIQKIVNLRKDGTTIQEIVKEFGVSRSVIYRCSKDFMPQKTVYSDKQIIEMKEKRKNGASMKQLMDEYDISYGTLFRRLSD